VEGYPQQIINFFIIIASHRSLVLRIALILLQGLFLPAWKKPEARRPFKGGYEIGLQEILSHRGLTVWLPIAIFFLAAAVFCKQLWQYPMHNMSDA